LFQWTVSFLVTVFAVFVFQVSAHFCIILQSAIALAMLMLASTTKPLLIDVSVLIFTACMKAVASALTARFVVV